jgi:hypothetical protein
MAEDPKHYYLAFNTGDWMKAADVGMCSPATRGIWMDAICAMHLAGRTGLLSGTPRQLSQILRCTLDEFATAFAELKAQKVGDVKMKNGVVTLVNRRMQRQHREREATKKRVDKCRRNAKGNAESNAPETPHSHSHSHNSSSSPNPLTGVDDGPAAPGNEDPTTRAILADFGIEGVSLPRCANTPGLTPVVAIQLCERAKRVANRNPQGWLVSHLTKNGFHPPKVIPTEDVYRLAKDGRIGAVAGHELHPTEPNVGHGSGFVEFTDAGGTKRRVRAEQLTPDAITITVTQGRLQPCN